MASTTIDLPLIKPQWRAPASVVAYTTTRAGGVSIGRHSTLNLGLHVQDDPDYVLANRAKLPGADKLQWLDQVHGNRAVMLPAKDSEADASISSDPTLWCAIMTADCVPVLLCNRQGTEVAAIHAGWQGLYSRIIARTIQTMRSSPEDILAWIGPAICGFHYQVDETLANKFSVYKGVAVPDEAPGKWRLDLPGIARYQLHNAGVDAVTDAKRCTYHHNQEFFSHRRSMHEHSGTPGRMVSVIGLV